MGADKENPSESLAEGLEVKAGLTRGYATGWAVSVSFRLKMFRVRASGEFVGLPGISRSPYK